jgi:DNA-binding HxlR family transcriptional regulator
MTRGEHRPAESHPDDPDEPPGPRTSGDVTVEHLEVLHAILDHGWDVAVVVCLADGPLRFASLRTRCETWRCKSMDNRELSRSLASLRDARMLTQNRGDGSYALSEHGRERLAFLAEVARTVDRHHRHQSPDPDAGS